MSNYNGWANYQTWNIFLWLTNDWGLYSSLQWRVDNGGFKEFTPQNIRSFCIFDIQGSTPDGVSYNDTAIDWGEIAESLNETFGLTEV